MRFVATFLLLILVTAPGWAVEGTSVEMGERLFSTPVFGETGRSCATCHPGGGGLEGIGDFSDAQLREIVNACIRDALKGEPIDSHSTEMNSLIRYLRTL